MQALIVIPVRYGSTRFPGKPLHMISGKTMLQRMCEIGQTATGRFSDVHLMVTTDDQRVQQHAEQIGVSVVMTSSECETGTDRVLTAVKCLKDQPNIVINLQGDSIFTPPDFIEALIKTMLDNSSITTVTPAVQLSWDELDQLRKHKETTPFSGTCVVIDKNHQALWFSKTIIPVIRRESELRQIMEKSPVYRHIGLYGYTRNALEKYATLEPTLYEKLEGLEQLRLLENGYPIKIVEVDYQSRPQMSGIDTLEDAVRAEVLLEQIEG
jgi:3-deoxy-manno-octulosonate cytidylyltransferase (CMP-KDO synthetase)